MGLLILSFYSQPSTVQGRRNPMFGTSLYIMVPGVECQQTVSDQPSTIHKSRRGWNISRFWHLYWTRNRKIVGLTPSISYMTFSHKVSGLTHYWCTPTKLCCRPVDHRFEETRWESFEADILVGIVRGNLHQVVRSVWVNLNGVIPSRLIEDLS